MNFQELGYFRFEDKVECNGCHFLEEIGRMCLFKVLEPEILIDYTENESEKMKRMEKCECLVQ